MHELESGLLTSIEATFDLRRGILTIGAFASLTMIRDAARLFS